MGDWSQILPKCWNEQVLQNISPSRRESKQKSKIYKKANKQIKNNKIKQKNKIIKNLKESENLKTKPTLLFLLLFLCILTDVRSFSFKWLSPYAPPWDEISFDVVIVISRMLKRIRYFMLCNWENQLFCNQLFCCWKIFLLPSKDFPV